MRTRPFLAMALLAAGISVVPSWVWADGLCHAGEQTYFSCPTKRHKTISLCGSLPATLQYRYGKPPAVELAFPDDAAQGTRQLATAHYARYQTDRTEVTFSRNGVDYALFDYTEGGHRTAGVRVTTPDGTDHEVDCAGAIRGELGTPAKSLQCDTDNALNGGACP